MITITITNEHKITYSSDINEFINHNDELLSLFNTDLFLETLFT